MTIFIQNDATGAGAGNLDPQQAALNLAVIANGDTGLGLAAQIGNRQQVTYARTLPGIPPTRLDNLVNTNFNPNYGSGAQNVNIVILPVLANFVLNDGTMITNVGGTALPPQNSGLAGATLNTTNDCLVIYDTTQSNGNGYCTARAGTGGTLDLPTPNTVILYHELSHAFRIVNNALLAVTAGCNPSSPEENAAITDENDLRTQIANATGVAVVLRDPGIHCGTLCSGGGGSTSCCIIASTASGSPFSEEVVALRSLRDGFVRKSEIGFAFFQSLYHDYYGFSPQVCTLMARHPEIRPLILEGFVRPLLDIFHMIEWYALDKQSMEKLGEKFVADHTDRASNAMRLCMLRQAHEVLDGNDAKITDVQQDLAQLLLPALESEHLRWALIEPFQIYESLLQTYLNECTNEELGKQIHEAISSWTSRMPLDGIWASLTVSELQNEIQMLESLILRTPETRACFRDRLQKKFNGITAIELAYRDKKINAE